MDELERIKQRKLREMMRKDSSKIDESGHDWPGGPVELSDDTFKEVIRKYPLVVVDCWAEWCAPCRRLAGQWSRLVRP